MGYTFLTRNSTKFLHRDKVLQNLEKYEWMYSWRTREKFCWKILLTLILGWRYYLKKRRIQNKKVDFEKGVEVSATYYSIGVGWEGAKEVEEYFMQSLSVFYCFFLWEKRLASKIYLGPLPFYVLFTWLLGYFDLPSYGLESKNWYALRLLLMCLWGRDGCWRFEVVLPEGQIIALG